MDLSHISIEEAHLQYVGGCAVLISHIISTDKGVHYRLPKLLRGLFVDFFIFIVKKCYKAKLSLNLYIDVDWRVILSVRLGKD